MNSTLTYPSCNENCQECKEYNNIREVTKFKFDNVRPDSKFDKCFERFVVKCEFVEQFLFYDRLHMHREHRQIYYSY